MDIFGFMRIIHEVEEEEPEEKSIDQQMEEALGEKKDEVMGLIEYYAKLRVLILKRMRNLKKIPQEFVDKYNDTIAKIRKAIKPDEEE